MSKYADKIVEIVLNSRAHLTAEQVFLEMKKTYPKVVLATIYNNLNMLVSEGKLRRVSIEGSPDRYDRTERHDHMICMECGALSDITIQDMTQMIERQTGGKILSYDLKINYICSECKNKLKENKHE